MSAEADTARLNGIFLDYTESEYCWLNGIVHQRHMYFFWYVTLG